MKAENINVSISKLIKPRVFLVDGVQDAEQMSLKNCLALLCKDLRDCKVFGGTGEVRQGRDEKVGCVSNCLTHTPYLVCFLTSSAFAPSRAENRVTPGKSGKMRERLE